MEFTRDINRDALSQAIWKWLTVLVVLLGAAMRLRIYCFNRSLWSDEALLALNFLYRDLASLLTAPLDYGQAAPLGFIVVVRVMAVLFGQHDYILRLLPFLASIGSLGCAFYLARRLIHKDPARFVFLTLMSFSPVLLYYSTEFKYYSLDTFFTLALLCGYVAPKWRLMICAIVGAAGVWFSHPVVFVMAGVGLAFFVEMVRVRSWSRVKRLAVLAGFWLVSFAVNFALVLQTYSKDEYLQNYWKSGYAPLPFSSHALRWYYESVAGLAHLAFRQCLPSSPVTEASWFYPWTIALAVGILLGVLFVCIRKPAIAFILTVTVLANLIVSGLGIYPFRNRLILYLVPLVYLAVAFLVQEFLLRLKMTGVGWMAAVLFVGTVLPAGTKMAWHPVNYSDIKTALKTVSDQQKPGDMLAINLWGDASYKYYKRDYPAGDLPLAVVVCDGDEAAAVAGLIAQYATDRVWMIHLQEPSFDFFGDLRAFMNVELVWQGKGAYVYLLTIY